MSRTDPFTFLFRTSCFNRPLVRVSNGLSEEEGGGFEVGRFFWSLVNLERDFRVPVLATGLVDFEEEGERWKGLVLEVMLGAGVVGVERLGGLNDWEGAGRERTRGLREEEGGVSDGEEGEGGVRGERRRTLKGC